MSRLEFSRKTRAQGFARCQGKCEICGVRLHPGRFQFHHIVEANDGGDGSLGNMQVICSGCHAPLTKLYTQELRKSQRIADKNTGAWLRTKRPLPGGRRSKWKIKMSGEVVLRHGRQDEEFV